MLTNFHKELGECSCSSKKEVKVAFISFLSEAGQNSNMTSIQKENERNPKPETASNLLKDTPICPHTKQTKSEPNPTDNVSTIQVDLCQLGLSSPKDAVHCVNYQHSLLL